VSGVLSVTGPVTLAEVARWKEELAGGARNRLILTDSGPWDLAGLQLLLAALSEAERRGVTISLAGIPSVLQSLATRAGLVDRLGPLVDDTSG
jgi:ABC-type transporter Mla MlaB component